VPARSIEKVVRWRKGFVALLRDPSLGLHLYASSDGEHWQSLDDQLPEAYWRVVESPAGLLALEFDPESPPGELVPEADCNVVPTGKLPTAWASADGFHWQKEGPVTGLGDPTYLGLAGSDTLIVAVACTDAGISSGSAKSYSLLTSTDGTNWVPETGPGLSRPYALLYGRGRFLVVSAGVWSSADGRTWTQSTSDQDAGLPPFGPARVEVASGGFLGFDPNFGVSWRSTDGIHWHIRYELPFMPAQQIEGRTNECPGSYGVGDGYRFVAYGGPDWTFTSLDGETWTRLDYAPQPAGLDAWDPYTRGNCNPNRPLMLMPRGLLAGDRDAAAYGASR
jgi:hypothetical protein